MPRQLHWLTSRSVSAWHALKRAAAGRPLVDPALAERLAPLIGQFAAVDALAGDSSGRLWRHLIPLSATVEAPQQLTRQALDKALGAGRPGALDGKLAELIQELALCLDPFWADLHEELELRSGPLREQWDTRGPGLLEQLARFSEPELVPEQAQVLLIAPVGGGGGAAHPWYNSVRFEAVLTNPLAQLPEVVRLAWLVAQLQLDLPRYEGWLPSDRLLELGSLALVPISVAAAAEVELTTLAPETIALALSAWELADPPAPMAATLWQWWRAYADTAPSWPTAMLGLERLIAEQGG